MIIFPAAPGGHAIFCDDLREEVGGKNSLIGVYGSDLMINATPPVMLPQLSCVATINLDPERMPGQLTIQIKKYLPSGVEEVLTAVELPPFADIPQPEYRPGYGDSKRLFTLSAAMKMVPLAIEGEFTLRAVALIDDDEYRLGGLTVRLQPNGPPSELK